MTIEECLAELETARYADTERAHGIADCAILKFLETNGYKVIVDKWNEIEAEHDGFWYA